MKKPTLGVPSVVQLDGLLKPQRIDESTTLNGTLSVVAPATVTVVFKGLRGECVDCGTVTGHSRLCSSCDDPWPWCEQHDPGPDYVCRECVARREDTE